MLIRQAESCIETLEDYICREEVGIITTSRISDDLHDQSHTERIGKVFFYELEETDRAFTNYYPGLETLDYNTLGLRIKCSDLRNKCDEILGSF